MSQIVIIFIINPKNVSSVPEEVFVVDAADISLVAWLLIFVGVTYQLTEPSKQELSCVFCSPS